VTILHATPHIPATAALQREKISCPLLCLHPSPVVTGDVHQMLMRNQMHQIDLGAIVHLIRAILRKFQECVGIALDKVGLAAKQMTRRQRFELMLAKRNGPDNQRYFIEHVSL
jgi:hypothetical protein